MSATSSPLAMLTIGVLLGGILTYMMVLPQLNAAALPQRECPPTGNAGADNSFNSQLGSNNNNNNNMGETNVQQVRPKVPSKTAVARNLTLFPNIPRPYACLKGAASVDVSLRQSWITEDPQPVRYKMFLHPADQDIYVSATIYGNEGNNMFEMDLKAQLYRYIRATDGSYPKPENPIFLDVGANIGTHSLFFAAIGVRTHGFEPMPKNLNLIRCSVSSNPSMASTYEANGFGLSDKNNEGMCMRVDWNNQGNAFLETGEDCTIGGIKLRRLDDYWKQVMKSEHPFAMKMDAQGFEGFVIKGGAEMFRTKPPVVFFMEYSPFRYRQYGIDASQILIDLMNYGYTIKWFNKVVTVENGLVAKLAQSGDQIEENLVLVHHGLLDKLRNGLIKF
jgi:FkbM family methyltransferase